MSEHDTIPASALSRQVADLIERPQREVASIIEALEAVISGHLEAGRSVRLGRLGALKVKDRPARTRLAFGKEVEIPAGLKVTFSPSKALKDTLG